MIGLADILAAQAALQGAVLRTPLVEAPALSGLTGATVFLKLENLQLTGSFKTRGALVRLLALSEGQRKAGVVAMSAGNHAQGVAWHARALGIPATIVMPEATPFTKVERTEALGARVVLSGTGLAQAKAEADRLVESDGLTLIHPYDDPRIIAGQGTIGLEIMADRPDLDILVVPVGGGGLMSGIAIAARSVKPAIGLIGVQAEGFSPFARAPVCPVSARMQTLAEGIAVKHPGTLTRPLVDSLADDVVTVDETGLEQAVEALVERQKLVAEGAGAAPLAALLADPARFAGQKVGLVVSGGNIDNRLLSSILMRGLVRAGRLARLRVEISDAPGTLAKITALIGRNGGNILEVHHQRLFQDIPVKYAEVDVVVETIDTAHVARMVENLTTDGFPTRLLGSRASGE